jgi:hypothetical protein
VNKHHEQDYVGMRTIDIINKQAEEQDQLDKKLLGGKSVGNLHKSNAINAKSISADSAHLTQPKSQV